MLIDIEKYVRQLLPPNRREPVTVALATMLLWPVKSLVDAFNIFREKCLYEIGQPGQLAVLQFRLRELIDANIQVLDADGFRLDFRVIVPFLTVDKERQVRAIVEKYRLRSKRYEIKEQPDWSTGDGVSFWEDYPYAFQVSDYYMIAIALDGLTADKDYRTRIIDPNGNTIMDAVVQYSQGITYSFNIPTAPGVFKVFVGSLSSVVLLEVEANEFDLTWADYHATEPTASLQARVQNGVRQLYIMLYSSRANIAPFTTRVFDSTSNLVHTFTWPNPQGQWHDLPTLPDGTYSVECIDVQGGITPRRSIVFTTSVSSLILSGLSSALLTDRYRVNFNISGGAGPYTVQFRNLSNTLLHSASIANAGAGQIVLPPSIGAQTLNVKVLDSSSPVKEATGVVILSDVIEDGDYGVATSGVDFMQSPNELFKSQFIGGWRMDLSIDNSGIVHDNWHEDTYSGLQRQAVLGGDTYNVFYEVYSNVYQDLETLSPVLPKGMIHHITKIYGRASKFPDIATLKATSHELTPEDDDLYDVCTIQLLIY